MITINIGEETYSGSDMADTLRRIADMIDESYTSGIDPAWSLNGEEEDYNEDPEDEEENCEM